MFDIVPLRMEHIKRLSHEPSTAHLKEWINGGRAAQLVAADEQVAGLVTDEIMILAGLCKYWDGRAHLWCVFSEKAKGNFVSVFRGIQKYLETRPYRRIEMDVPLDLPSTEVAHRRAMMLGFELECKRAKAYRPNGADAALYSWIKGARDV